MEVVTPRNDLGFDLLRQFINPFDRCAYRNYSSRKKKEDEAHGDNRRLIIREPPKRAANGAQRKGLRHPDSPRFPRKARPKSVVCIGLK
jgi:hypothetical protein